MDKIKSLDVSIVLAGLLIVIFSKAATTSWTSIIIAAFGGALIGSALTYMSIRTNRRKEK